MKNNIIAIVVLIFLVACNSNETNSNSTKTENNTAFSKNITAADFIGKWRQYNTCFDNNKDGKLEGIEIIIPTDDDLKDQLKKGMNEYFFEIKADGTIMPSTNIADIDKGMKAFTYKYDEATKTLQINTGLMKTIGAINKDGIFINKSKMGDEDAYQVFKKVN
jgi:hypothetical protein